MRPLVSAPVRLGWLTATPLAHRGLHDRTGGVIENTPDAFAAAMAIGAAIECDVQLTSNGRACVFHDYTLERLTEGSGRVDALTDKALARIAFKHGSGEIVTLRTLLEMVAGKVTVVVELKSRFDDSRALATAVAREIAGYRGRLALMSFDPFLLEALLSAAPHIPRGIVVDRAMIGNWPGLSLARRIAMRRLAHPGHAHADFLSHDVRALPSFASRQFRRAGKPVICWTVRDRQTARRAKRYADQITFEGFVPAELEKPVR